MLGAAPLGPYQLQAAIAAVHDEAPSAADTDWAEILELYELLDRVAPNPMATLNRVVAVAEVHGPDAGARAARVTRRRRSHRRRTTARTRCARHLLERVGDVTAARAAYLEAARRATSRPEQRHLESRAARLCSRLIVSAPLDGDIRRQGRQNGRGRSRATGRAR